MLGSERLNGIQFYEERYRSLGALGHHKRYPEATPANPNAHVYPTTLKPGEEFF